MLQIKLVNKNTWTCKLQRLATRGALRTTRLISIKQF